MNEEEARETLKTMKENIDKKYLKTRNSVAIETVLKLLEKKDKQIDLMSNYICCMAYDKIIKKLKEDDIAYYGIEGSIKQYFENKVKE
jgi:hypothetical protein